MFGNEFIQNYGIVTIPPQDLNDAAVDSEWINMSKYRHATVLISVGDTAGATFAITINEATTNTGTGEQVLAYTKLYSTAQKLVIGTVSGTFTIGETITGSLSALTAEVFKVSNDSIIVRSLTGGTTWTTTETITGGSSGATAVVSGTGKDEDTFVTTATAPSSTFTVPAVTFKNYIIEIDATSLTVNDGYDHIQVALSDPGGATLASGTVILTPIGSHRGIPMNSAIGTQKYVATSA